jgi:hypothetical protein
MKKTILMGLVQVIFLAQGFAYLVPGPGSGGGGAKEGDNGNPPQYNPPAYEPPAYNPPAYNPPSYNPPHYEPPAYNPPSYNPPHYDPPAYNPPYYNPPHYNPPVYNPPSYDPPYYNPPSYDPPYYNPPSYDSNPYWDEYAQEYVETIDVFATVENGMMKDQNFDLKPFMSGLQGYNKFLIVKAEVQFAEKFKGKLKLLQGSSVANGSYSSSKKSWKFVMFEDGPTFNLNKQAAVKISGEAQIKSIKITYRVW